MKTFLDVPAEDFLAFLKKQDVPSFRANQIYDWLFKKGASSFSGMSNLPENLRKLLDEEYRLHPLTVRHKEVSKLDGTIRYHFRGHDGKDISTVFLPEGERLSLCLSTQVGCAYRCTFCASGLVPFQRQLSAAEIVDQVLQITRFEKRRPTNLLFMGMGEPLANITQVIKSIQWFTSPNAFGMSPGRITLSTSGLIPQIQKLAEANVKVKLAISLHAVRDDLREKIMPVSGKFKVRDLIKAAKNYSRATGLPVTFEYILLDNVNDRLIDAQRLAYLVKGFPSLVNVIAYNPVKGLPYKRPENFSVIRFQNWLREKSVPVFVRKPKGLDIGSACGQLGVPEV